jgi:riboflavin synthase
MFTGIVKEVGRIDKITRSGSSTILGVKAGAMGIEAKLSDSVAVNGVCLTLAEKEKDILFFEAVAPTIAKTNLKDLKLSEVVNLEPALSVGDKLGGHFVLGHVDCAARIKAIINHGAFRQVEIDLPVGFKKYVIANGSIAVDGVSLTIKKVMARSFTLDIIPFTWEHTALKFRHPGYMVNLEFDYLLKGNLGK